jgi:hypothetical protein
LFGIFQVVWTYQTFVFNKLGNYNGKNCGLILSESNEMTFSLMPPKKKPEENLKYRYQQACSRYGCEPLSCITKRIDETLQHGNQFDQVTVFEIDYYSVA